jgi:hypothetical protein
MHVGSRRDAHVAECVAQQERTCTSASEEKAERLHPATSPGCSLLEVVPRLARSTCTGTGEPGIHQAVPSVTSKVCGAPPSRTKVTLTVLPGA